MASQDCPQSGLGQELSGPFHVNHISDRDDWIKDAIVHDRIHVHWNTVFG